MTRVDIIDLTASICCLMLFTLPAAATENTCLKLTVDISGTLPVEQSTITAGTNDVTLEVPLKEIDADDTTFTLRFRQTAERIWVADLLAANKTAPDSDKHFQKFAMHIYFDELGRQEAEQGMSIVPPSNNERGGTAVVHLRLEKLELVADHPKISILSTSVSETTCPRLGELDVQNEVNGGRVREVRYYETDEEGLRAMLLDRP